MWDALQSPTGLTALAAIILGGLFGTIVTLIFSNRHNKNLLTISVINDYLDNYHSIHATVYWIIEGTYDDEKEEHINDVIKFGNWADSVAVLVINRLVNKKILKEYGLLKEFREFYSKICSSPASSKARPENWRNLERL